MILTCGSRTLSYLRSKVSLHFSMLLLHVRGILTFCRNNTNYGPIERKVVAWYTAFRRCRMAREPINCVSGPMCRTWLCNVQCHYVVSWCSCKPGAEPAQITPEPLPRPGGTEKRALSRCKGGPKRALFCLLYTSDAADE